MNLQILQEQSAMAEQLDRYGQHDAAMERYRFIVQNLEIELAAQTRTGRIIGTSIGCTVGLLIPICQHCHRTPGRLLGLSTLR